VVSRRGHGQERDLADAHARVEGDGQAGDVRQLERDVAVEARVDEARSRVDQQAEAAEARLAVQPPDQVVAEGDPLERRAEHELARVEHEDPVLGDLHQLGQVLEVLLHVDQARGVVAEHPEEPVELEVDRRGLDARLVEGVDDDPAAGERLSDAAIGEDHDAAP
jgi:hypothetical protein